MENILQKRNAIGRYSYLWESNGKYLSDSTLKVSYVSLHLVDLILTQIGIYLGFSELNIVMKGLLANPLQLLAFKLALPVFIAWLVPGKFLIPAIVLLLLVVGWDIKELLLWLF